MPISAGSLKKQESSRKTSKKKEKRHDQSRAVYLQLLLALAHGAEATSTYRQRLGGAVNNSLYLANIGLPGSVGMTVRVRNALSENNALSANFTLCHVSIPNLS